MMRTNGLILLIVGLCFIPVFGLNAQTVSLDTNRMRIGEHNVFSFSLNAAEYDLNKIAWPSLNEILGNINFDIVDIGKQDSVFDANGKLISLGQKIVFSVFDSGLYVIPSFGISPMNADVDGFVAYTDSLMLEVLTIPVDTTQAFKDIKGPMDEPIRFSEILPYILMGLFFIVLLILAYYFYHRYKKKKPLFKIMQKEVLKPHDWALAELMKIKNKKIWQNGFVKEYYVDITDVIRRYFEEEFSFGAMEMTSSEILSKLKLDGFEKNLVEKVDFILTNADLAKFAKSQPLDVDNEKCIEFAIEVIRQSHEMFLKTQTVNLEVKGGHEE
jgi:hypothetical protein